jgi:hypothetical protein
MLLAGGAWLNRLIGSLKEGPTIDQTATPRTRDSWVVSTGPRTAVSPLHLPNDVAEFRNLH